MNMPEIYRLLFSSILSVLYLFTVAKLLGKKQIAQLDFVDYVLGISIGSIAADMASDVGETPFYYYLIAMAIFFLFNLIISLLGRKGPMLKHFFKGRPAVVIYDGQIKYDALKQSKIDVNDLIALCRDKGYFDVNDVAYAVFETNGALSVLPKANQKPLVIEDIDKKIEQASLPYYLVIDGEFSYSTLTELKKDENWFFEQTKLDRKNLKNVILAIYDDKNKKINVQTKR